MKRLQRNRESERSGVATVELAVCLPAIVLLVFASIEACTMIFVNQSLAVTAYEGVRVAIEKDSTSSSVVERCNAVLKARKVADATITIDPPDVASVPRGEAITLTVSAPCDANSAMPNWFFGGKVMDATAVMVKE